MDNAISDFAMGRDFQVKLLVHMAHDSNLLQYSCRHLKPEDFDVMACKVVYIALAGFFEKYHVAPPLDVLQREVIMVAGGRDAKTMLMPEEEEFLAYLITAITNPGQLTASYYRTELVSWVKHVRTKRIIADRTEALARGLGHEELITELAALDTLKPTAGITMSSVLHEPQPIMDARQLKRITTGIAVLDGYIYGGLGTKEVGLITACPGVGKTNTQLNFAVGAARANWHGLIVTLEMDAEKMKHRYQAMMGHIQGNLLMTPLPTWPTPELERYSKMLQSPIAENMMIAHMSDKKHTVQNVEEAIVNWLAYEQQHYGNTDRAKLVCVDWLDMIKHGSPGKGKGDRDWDVLVSVTEELGRIARSYDIALWTATQATKEAEGALHAGMKHTAFAYHKNDFVHLSIIITAPWTEDPIRKDAGNDDNVATAHLCKRVLHYTIAKNRDNTTGHFTLWQGPTLKLFKNEAEGRYWDKLVAAGNTDLLFKGPETNA